MTGSRQHAPVPHPGMCLRCTGRIGQPRERSPRPAHEHSRRGCPRRDRGHAVHASEYPLTRRTIAAHSMNPDHVKLVLAGPNGLHLWLEANGYPQLDLSDAKLRLDFPGQLLDLHRANCRGADFRGSRCRINFQGADLTDARLDEAVLDGSSFSAAQMVGYWDPTSKRPSSVGPARLHGANLTRASLRNCDFRYVTLDASILIDTCLSGSDFRGASFSGSHFQNTDFSNSRRAHLGGIDHGLVKMLGARTTWSDVRGSYTGAYVSVHLVLFLLLVAPYLLRGWGYIVATHSDTAVRALAEAMHLPALPSQDRAALWRLLIGADSSMIQAAISISLVAYGIARVSMVYYVGRLAADEDRERRFPPITPISWLVLSHGVIQALFALNALQSLCSWKAWLSTDVITLVSK